MRVKIQGRSPVKNAQISRIDLARVYAESGRMRRRRDTHTTSISDLA